MSANHNGKCRGSLGQDERGAEGVRQVRLGPARAARPEATNAVVASAAVTFTLAVAGCGAVQAPLGARSAVVFRRLTGTPNGGVAVTRDGRFGFVDLMQGLQGRLLVYSTRRFPPRLVRSYAVPGEAVGSSLTRDGRVLLIASERGSAVVSVPEAEQGARHPVLGVLSPPPGARLRASGAIETASSPDGRYVFVSLEHGPSGGAIAVYRIGSTSTPHFTRSDFVGAITLGQAVVGSALSPNGRDLYVTSELAGSGSGPDAGGDGTLSVVDVSAAERASAHSVIATAPALQQPVRVAVSPDGSVVWVTARASNRLLAFSAAKLLSDPSGALLADLKVGTAPVGVAFDDGGRQVVVADSNRFDARGAHAAITIVDADAALAHRPAIIATLTAGQFPREIRVEPDGVALVSDYGSDQLEAIQPVASH